MRFVSGVDGSPEGWFVVNRDVDSGSISWRVCRRASELLNFGPLPEVIALDIPIGLPDSGSRRCDVEARRLLGSKRGTSVFPAPIRPVLSAVSYEEACAIGQAVHGKKVSKQAWELIPKIRDVDKSIRQDPFLRKRLREVHPEVSFRQLAGGSPLEDKKRSPDGHAIRRRLLEPHFGDWIEVALNERTRFGCAPDDILDAFVALWAAERIANGDAHTIPAVPPSDQFGLSMEINV